MEINRRSFVLTTILVAILSFTCGYAVQNRWFTPHQDPKIQTNVIVQVEDGVGTRDILVGNTITNWGENLTRDIFYNTTAFSEDLDNIALGNQSSTIATSTSLDQEGDRKDVGAAGGANMTAWINGGDAALNVTYKFTSPTFACNATALHTQNSGENAYAIATFTQQSGTYNITITWTITYDGN